MRSLYGLFLAAVNVVYAAMFGGPIDGTAWDVKVKEEGLFHWGSQKETLVFHGGKAVIAGEIAKGYAPALYEARSVGAGTAFSVILAEDGRDPVEWSGRVDGGLISGFVVVRSRDGRSRRYVFTGARKAGAG